MVRVLVLGALALVGLSACGETERDSAKPLAMAGTGAGGVAGNVVGSAGAALLAGAAPLAGAGAGAGAGGTSALAAAVAQCEDYCDTLDFLLPGALCEDWNRPAYGWEPQFCHLGPTMGCADYCTQLYATVRPACAETLPAAIRCVAPTYESVNLPKLDQCWLEDCRQQLYTMTSACYGLREKLAAARATWQANGIADYRLEYALSPETKAQVIVHAGSEPTVTPPDAVAWTVPKLFDEVERVLDEPGVAPYAGYDPELGYVQFIVSQQGCENDSAIVSGVELTPLP